jgi:DtxR family transcriptional regulator, Mn-dependent transcriptional regulator
MSGKGSRSPLWRAFEANEITHSAAHYLLAIASLTREGRRPRAVDIARHLHVSRAAASLQLHSLQEHGLVEVDPRQLLHLTGDGADLVARVASKREVLRVFLSDVLRVRGETAEIDACKVEHLLSEETGAALVRWTRFLGSGHPAVAAFLEAFHETTANCPPGSRCELCTDACLLALGEPADGEGPPH